MKLHTIIPATTNLMKMEMKLLLGTEMKLIDMFVATVIEDLHLKFI